MQPDSRLQAHIVRRPIFPLLFGLSTLVFGLWTSSAAQNPDSGVNPTDYRNFEVIAKKNIFNPRRSPAYVPSERPQTRARRTESLALVGVMSYGKGPMAFFEGTRSDYRKVLKPNDTIAGFRVTAIESSSVKLAGSANNEIELPLGMQLAREEEGEWKLAVRPESFESLARETAMRSASSVNAERASAATAENNPFAAIGNFFRGGGGPGGNFPGSFTQDSQTQPTMNAAPTQSTTPIDPGEVLRRMALRRQQETGESPAQQSDRSPDEGRQPSDRFQRREQPATPRSQDGSSQSNLQEAPSLNPAEDTTPRRQVETPPVQGGQSSPIQPVEPPNQ